jgi:hypothetical protein
VLVGEHPQRLDERAQAHLDVDVLLAVHRDQQVALRLEADARQDAGAPDRVLVVANHLQDRIADHEDPLARDPLAQKVRAAAPGVRHQDVARDSLHGAGVAIRLSGRVPVEPRTQALGGRLWHQPMVGVIEGFRWALLGQSKPSGPMVAVSALMVAVLRRGAPILPPHGAIIRGVV